MLLFAKISIKTFISRLLFFKKHITLSDIVKMIADLLFNADRFFGREGFIDGNRFFGADGFFGTNQNHFNPSYFKNFHDLRPPVKRHLTKVYATLTCMLAATSVGVWLSISGRYDPGPNMSFLLTFGSICGLFFTYDYPDTSSLRQNLLLTFCVCQGLSLSPLIDYAIDTDPTIIFMAAISTFLVFASFTLCSLFSKRRSHLYLGSILGSATFILFGSSILNSYFYFRGFYMLQLYGGLIIFCLYVLYDTQKIIEEANRGNKKVINQALALFTDVIAIFVRIVHILINNKHESERKKSRRDRLERLKALDKLEK
jgi:FtsH-binding integral membrane protein